MNITSIWTDDVINELIEGYLEIHSVKKLLKGEGGQSSEIKIEDKFVQSGNDHLLRVALIIGS